jgi:hypothetical protein
MTGTEELVAGAVSERADAGSVVGLFAKLDWNKTGECLTRNSLITVTE